MKLVVSFHPQTNRNYKWKGFYFTMYILESHFLEMPYDQHISHIYKKELCCCVWVIVFLVIRYWFRLCSSWTMYWTCSASWGAAALDVLQTPCYWWDFNGGSRVLWQTGSRSQVNHTQNSVHAVFLSFNVISCIWFCPSGFSPNEHQMAN